MIFLCLANFIQYNVLEPILHGYGGMTVYLICDDFHGNLSSLKLDNIFKNYFINSNLQL